jgi:hypothetical protein
MGFPGQADIGFDGDSAAHDHLRDIAGILQLDIHQHIDQGAARLKREFLAAAAELVQLDQAGRDHPPDHTGIEAVERLARIERGEAAAGAGQRTLRDGGQNGGLARRGGRVLGQYCRGLEKHEQGGAGSCPETGGAHKTSTRLMAH